MHTPAVPLESRTKHPRFVRFFINTLPMAKKGQNIYTEAMASDKDHIFFTNLADLQESLSDEHETVGGRPIGDLKKESTAPQWFADGFEGELAVDVYQTADAIIVKSTIAGVRPQDLEVYVHNDLLTIRGKREKQEEETGADYFYKECYWGGFSRTIILPVDVHTDRIKATFKNGILTVVLPKAKKSSAVQVDIES